MYGTATPDVPEPYSINCFNGAVLSTNDVQKARVPPTTTRDLNFIHEQNPLLIIAKGQMHNFVPV